MKDSNVTILIPMAGLGTRFKNEGFELPKPLIKVNGKTLIEHSVTSLGIKGNYIFITRKYENPNENILLSKKLKELSPNCIEITLQSPTRGAVETCLFAEKFINNDEPLIITNCDQITDWTPEEFENFINDDELDGSIVTYTSVNPKNSFAIVNNGIVQKLVEKNQVSDIALIGLHQWKKGKDFVESAKNLLRDFEENGRPECYISESYNYLIENGKKIKNFHISANQFIPLGTPYDLKVYQGKLKEFYTEKPKTIFCDIDGTILKHLHRFSDLMENKPIILPGVIEKINQWDSLGHTIIFVTARKESSREMTESHLKKLGLCWDHLIMGVTSGHRVLINDKLTKNNPNRAISVNLITDGGFELINWEEFGL
jgi:dTDP-glucose pyrophosphorylase